MGKRELSKKDLEMMQKTKAFYIRGRREICPATGYEVRIEGIWWPQYIDSEGHYHYGV